MKATIVGTPGSDQLKGTAGDDVIVGRGGDDQVRGRGGNDRICAGPGDDDPSGGVGEDRISGGPGDDELIGGAGDDVIAGGEGADWVVYLSAPGPLAVDLTAGIANGEGSDTLAGIENVYGSAYNDVIAGNSGPNFVWDFGGDNVINGLAGDDTFWGLGEAGNDLFDGGDGEDWIVYAFATGPVEVNLTTGTATGLGSDTLVDVEDVYGSSGDDTLIGDAGPNQLVGGYDGEDTISGGDGDDLLVGDDPFCGWLPCDPGEGAYDDVLDGGSGVDTVSYEFADGPVQVDLAEGTAIGQGSDTLTGIENTVGGWSDDTLTGDAGPNQLSGGRGEDSLFGAEGDDSLDGGPGTDSLDGGPGTDSCVHAETTSNCEVSTPPGNRTRDLVPTRKGRLPLTRLGPRP